jgi:hypothetical protein
MSVADSALSEKPALESIERGETGKGTYENGEIGLSYRYPTTWESSTAEPLAPAKDEIVQRTRDVLDACSLMLLRLRPAGDTSADERQITLRAVDQTCLGLPAPVSSTDHLGAEELGAYLQMLGAFGEVRSSKLVMHGDQLFAEYSGVVGERLDGQALGHRRAEAMAVTRHRKLLLVWMWTAGSPAELAAMPITTVRFEDTAPIELKPAELAAKK